MIKKSFFALLITSFVLVVSIGLWIAFVGNEFVNKAPSDLNTEVIYEVLPSKSFNAIAKDLESQKVITNANLFSFYARFKGDRSKLKVGEYLFNTKMKPNEVLAILISGKSIERKFTVPEGLNIYEIADLYEKNNLGKKEDFLGLCKNKEMINTLLSDSKVESLEGYLFPDTYSITKYVDTKSLITKMVKASLENYISVTGGKQTWIGGRHEFLTLASLVEKESGSSGDRPLVASVFKNRLSKKMRLQTDPTILYGIADVTGVLKENITKADILAPTRYNTYTIDGLPPGPISNPGKDSMFAALNPAETSYLYFVSRNDGTTQFSASLDQHNKSVQKFQVDPKAREGKSWRDLKK